jgi:hypothetical protein
MKYISKFFIGLAMVLMIAVPQVALSQNNNTNANTSSSSGDTCDELREKFENAGGSAVIEGVPEYCSVESIYSKFVNVALFAIGIVAVIGVIYGGYLYMTAAGNDSQVKKGRQVLTWSIIGLLVVLAAATIVNVVVDLLVDNRFV